MGCRLTITVTTDTGAKADKPRANLGRNLRVWTILGQLRDEVVREIADRIRAGQKYDEISVAIGIGKTTGRRKCAEIAAALGVPPELSRYEADTAAVLRRVEEGQRDPEIASALGRSVESVACIRRKHGIRYFTQLRISDDENAEIGRRLLAGQSTRVVAAAVGCEQADVQRRLRQIAHLKPKDLPPCACGKPCNHGGRCNLIVDPQVIRDRLLAGKSTADIAREFDRAAQGFKPKYVQPVIDQLTAEGHVCGCGKPFGHRFVCPVTMAATRRTFTDGERARAVQMFREGKSVVKVKADLGITTYSANMLAREVRTMLAAEGVRCPCGEPIDHDWSCTARNGQTNGRTGFRFSCAAAANMPVETRRKVSKLAREGWRISVIVKRTGETIWRVTQMVEELDRAGHLPAKCAGCDLPRGHKAPCRKSKMCECGRWRYHRGACRRPDGRKNVPFTKLSDEEVAEVKRKYRDRYSVRAISRATGIPFSVIQRLVKRWQAKSKYDLAPCACGKPARHGGSCWANSPGLVGKRHLTRIKQGILAGKTSHAIAEQLKLSVMTVLKHSVPIRDQLFTEGVTCACGRTLGHPYWCAAKWDQFDQRRGRRPLPPAIERLATDALVRGDLVAEIAKATRVGESAIWKLRQELSDADRIVRARALRNRLAQREDATGEKVMARIQSAVSRRLDPMLRDDVVGELYLAVIEGRLEVEQIGAAVRSFVSRGLTQWQSGFGPRSLDATIGETKLTIADRLRDDTASAGIDDMIIGGGA